ncbi:MAG: holo-ACP synthase [Clostridia bacterium]|nr:holo-ACP synthase [Clostridia bacterium]
MIGVDIEQIERFANWSEEGFKRVFSPAEIEYAKQFGNSLEHFCGFFCVKEAFVKVLDNPGIVYSQIEVLHTESGKPYINRTPYINSLLKEHFYNKLEISISHSKDYACATVLVE